jgi:CheB methylesterase
MAYRDILAIGTSAGGVEALLFLARRFPGNFPASIVVTIHLPSYCRSKLDTLLSDSGPLPATFARGRPKNSSSKPTPSASRSTASTKWLRPSKPTKPPSPPSLNVRPSEADTN